MSEDRIEIEKDIMRDMCINQGYVPERCTLPGHLILLLTTEQGDACKGCNGNREICGGRHQTPCF